MTGRTRHGRGEIAEVVAAVQARIRSENERAVAELRELVPGVKGRLDGPRFYVTPAEAALIVANLSRVARTVEDPAPLAGIDIVIEEAP